MISLEDSKQELNLQEEFGHRQIGSITSQVDPVDVSASVEFVTNFFKSNPDKVALPIERNGVLIGILDRSIIQKIGESAWARFWQKDLDSYIHAPLLSLRAEDYIEKMIDKAMELNTEKGARFFAVFYRKSFFGIVGVHEMLSRVNEIRKHDLEKARVVQQNLLKSDSASPATEYSLLTWNRMANEVGGDFYKDFALAGGRRRLIGCFDVSGKNVAASLSTMAIGSFFTALTYFELTKNFGPEITLLMDSYVQDLTPGDMFITAALCYLDLDEGTVSIQNCGHTPVYVFIPEDTNRMIGRTVNPNLPPLGMGIINPEENTAWTVPITKGLRIAMYTDGLTDMVTPDGQRFDDERTRDLFASSCGKTGPRTRDYYTTTIDSWILDAMLPDDITIMDIRFS